ncbi:hypothetical protein PV328_004088 [Microctonus aethiopoides]|uniref:Uncharacterized protein n=1 Tax=Microctonus aethiopoides TaxID=144406 RepID=A0AA39F9S4_9HYME|nr:hypothetical protein PV328_004088 [Microctonus aethiopoides]
MAKRNHKKREEDKLKQIVKTSDIIRQKHKMIKLGRDKTEQAMKEVFKPVVTPLEKLVTTSNQMKREIKDEPTDIIPKEEIDQTYATAISENDYDEDGHTFNNGELKKTINQFESDDIPFESSLLKQHEMPYGTMMNIINHELEQIQQTISSIRNDVDVQRKNVSTMRNNFDVQKKNIASIRHDIDIQKKNILITRHNIDVPVTIEQLIHEYQQQQQH